MKHEEYTVESALEFYDPTARRQVACLYGVIDVVNCEYVIEVKRVQDWKHAIGQALVYALCFPHLRPRIHLFGPVTEYERILIEDVGVALRIAVTWHGEEA